MRFSFLFRFRPSDRNLMCRTPSQLDWTTNNEIDYTFDLINTEHCLSSPGCWKRNNGTHARSIGWYKRLLLAYLRTLRSSCLCFHHQLVSLLLSHCNDTLWRAHSIECWSVDFPLCAGFSDERFPHFCNIVTRSRGWASSALVDCCSTIWSFHTQIYDGKSKPQYIDNANSRQRSI
jgi:hypothetical protein